MMQGRLQKWYGETVLLEQVRHTPNIVPNPTLCPTYHARMSLSVGTLPARGYYVVTGTTALSLDCISGAARPTGSGKCRATDGAASEWRGASRLLWCGDCCVPCGCALRWVRHI